MTTIAAHPLDVPNVQLSLLAPAPLAASSLAEGGQDAVGWQLGFDHARQGVTLPPSHLHEASPLFAGWQAALARRLHRHRDPAPAVRRWLQLRLQAWTEGLDYEELLLTPNYLQQLDASHCPVSRELLHDEQDHPARRCLMRLRQDHGYTAGHLVCLSRRAADALQGRGLADLQALALQAARRAEPLHGLGAAAWARLVSLVAMVTPDSELGLLQALPTNRLQLERPQHALQAWISRQLARPGWSQRLQALHDALPGVPARQAASALSAALAPHALTLGHDDMARRWALEDMWSDGRVQRRWTALVQQVSPLTIERLLRQLPPPPGWALEQHHTQVLAA
ncbi:MAG: hypothetical protein ACK4F7_01510 [Inhella sp.]